jgi:hypothetical protein
VAKARLGYQHATGAIFNTRELSKGQISALLSQAIRREHDEAAQQKCVGRREVKVVGGRDVGSF